MGNTKSIAKNTIFLYVRMLFLLFVALYTSRVVFEVLGIDDYGIYNVVGGIIVLFSFISNAMTNATQRYFSFYLGKKDDYSLKNTFTSSLLTHGLVSVIVLILAETLGLWFVCNQLNIPEGRFDSAIIVYHLSVVTFIINILIVPYKSIIIAQEEMSFFALLSIAEAVLKLLAVYSLKVVNTDYLITYAVLMAVVPFLCGVIYGLFCHKRYSYCKLIKVKDFLFFKNLFSFSGWSMLGGFSNIGAQQGGNILINMFNGVAANAGFGIASQISHAISSFVNNFQTAFNPRIVKYYAQNDMQALNKLLLKTSSISFYVIWIISLPLLYNIDYIIGVWLGTVPPYACEFSFLMLMYYFVDSTQAPLFMSIYASGYIKEYQIWLSVLTILNIPISLYLLYMNFDVTYVLLVRVIINIIISVIRVFYVRKLFDFSVRNYLINGLFRNVYVVVITLLFVVILRKYLFFNTFIDVVMNCIVLISIVGITVFLVGFDKATKIELMKAIKSVVFKL